MCGKKAEVFCLAAAGFVEGDWQLDEFTHFSNVTALPDSLKAILKKQAPRYYLDYTRQRGSCYYMNHCRCGTKLTDFYLHNNPEGAFYPVSEQHAYSGESEHLFRLNVNTRISQHINDVIFTSGVHHGQEIPLF